MIYLVFQESLQHQVVVNGVWLKKELQSLIYKQLLIMLAEKEVQIAHKFNLEQVVMNQTLSLTMLLMPSTTTTRSIQYLPVVCSEEQQRLQATIQVSISSNIKAELNEIH